MTDAPTAVGIETTRHARGFVPGVGVRLHYGYWPGRGMPVVALHGVTASHYNFLGIAESLAGRRPLFAPDLRGRGDSDRAPDGDYGFDSLADDVATAMRAFGIGPSVVAGHSMGAWVGVALAARYPELVSGLVLIDGGLSVPPPPGVDVNELLDLILQPIQARLDRTWSSWEEFVEYWRVAGTMRPEDWTPAWEAYLRNDLTGEPPDMRSKAAVEALRANWIHMADREASEERLRAVRCPVRVVNAQYGMVWGADPIQPDSNMDDVARLAPVDWAGRVEGTTHYTIGFSDPGVGACAEHIVELADAVERGEGS